MPDSTPILVLLIEDDREYSETVTAVLESHSRPRFRVITMHTLSQAITYLEKAAVDIVLLDLNLPDSAGVDTVAAIQPARCQAPIVVLSGGVDGQIRQESLMSGAADAVDKSQINSALLIHILVTALEREKQQLLTQAKAGIERLDRIIQRLRAQALNGAPAP